MTGNDDDAWDVVQQVFERVLKHGDAFRGESSPMTYLYRITTNVAINQLRRATRVESDSQSTAAIETSEPLQRSDAHDFLKKLSRQMTARELEILTLHHIDELPQETIAHMLGLSRKTIGRELAAIMLKANSLMNVGEKKP